MHTDAHRYYERCAAITTEEDLAKLFEELASHRLDLSNRLLAVMPTASDKTFWKFRVPLSYLQKVWRNVKIALIVNHRSRILQYCLRAERFALSQHHKVLDVKGLTRDQVQQLQLHKDRLVEMIDVICTVPERRLNEASANAD